MTAPDLSTLRQELAKALFYEDGDQHVFNFTDTRNTLENDPYLPALIDALMPTVVQTLTDAPRAALTADEWREVMAVLRFNYNEGMQSEPEPTRGDRAFYSGVQKLDRIANPFASSGDTTNGDK